MNLFLRRSAFVLCFAVSAVSFAGETFQTLLQQQSRPTIAQVEEAMAQAPRGAGLHRDQLNVGTMNVAALESILPRVIAYMERSYPGAVWAALGRDAIGLADALDAFYRSIGQPDRVVRINMSGNTIAGAREKQLVEAMVGLGFDLENAASNPPFIVFDNTSYSAQSQSTQIMKAVYNAWKAAGNKPGDLVEKFNLMTTAGGVDPDQSPREVFLRKEELHANGGSGRPVSILSIPQGQGFMYGLEWHGPFGNLIPDPQTVWTGTPGFASQPEIRETILAQGIAWIRVVSKPDFLGKVKAVAGELGFDFPTTRQQVLPPLSPEEKHRRYMERLRSDLEKVLADLPPKGEQQKYLSDNGQQFQAWLDGAMGGTSQNPLAMLFIHKVLAAKADGKIGERDLRRLVARAFGHMSTPDSVLAQKFQELFEASEPLRDILNTRRSVFTEGKRPDAEKVAATFGYLEERLKCANILLTQPEPEKKPESDDKPGSEAAEYP